MIYSTMKCVQKYYEVMRERIFRLFFIAVLLTGYISVFSQETGKRIESFGSIIDSLKSRELILNTGRKSPEISLSKDDAVRFLQQKIQPQNWNNVSDPFRHILGQLIYEASNPPYDSIKYFLKSYPWDSINIPWDKFYMWEPLRLKIPEVSPSELAVPVDSVFKSAGGLKDTTILVMTDTLKEVTSSSSHFPFRYYTAPFQSDSIRVAVNSLLKYLEERDSTIISFTGLGNNVTPVRLNSKMNRMTRFWLRNEFSDSVTVWIGNPGRDTIDLYLEKGVNFKRPVRQGNYSDARINLQRLDNSKLLELQKVNIKPQYWKYRSEASFILSQASLTNWVKGGESSISTSMDITGYVDYNNKLLLLSSSNFARIKLGFLASGDNPVRKNIDLLETNSKLNHKAFGKFDFSAILLFKTQLARGYNYPNDSVPVSKFMNPSILTVGLGLDYKPNKLTSINFSPLSYKGTFVPDTAVIDQTKYGILKGKRSLNEPGASFMITNEFKPFKSVMVTNRLQLFTNYIHNPLNIDVDWEMIVVANLNWFTDVRFNTHLIFDDDTKTAELDKDKKPVLRADGTQKKTARTQFKEILGFSFVFRF
jgi:hypothetical protein